MQLIENRTHKSTNRNAITTDKFHDQNATEFVYELMEATPHHHFPRL